MRLMREKGTYYVPTIIAGLWVAEKAKDPDFFPELVRPKAAEIGPQIKGTFGKAYQAGVKIAYGTDTGVSAHGNNATEFKHMVEAGMPPMKAIQSATVEASKLLGRNSISTFFNLLIPLIRPAIIAGIALVAMETLSDFGAVSFFGIATLTTGIYDSWISFDDLAFANQLSFFLLLFILVLFFIENISRKKAQYHSPVKGGIKEKKKIKLNFSKGFLAFGFCFLVF